MPESSNNSQSPSKSSLLKRLAGRVTDGLNQLYKSTYYSDTSNRDTLQSLKTDISSSIKSIMDNNKDNIGVPNMSRVYERLLLDAQNNEKSVKEFESIFGDNEFVTNLANSYLDNRWVKAMDKEIDEVLRYMPKLQEAINVMRDNVLSSDSFSKDFLNLESMITVSSTDKEQFSRNVNRLKDRYNLLFEVKEWYDQISKYGEVFVYCVPYDKAIQKLMDTKQSNTGIFVKTAMSENSIQFSDTNGNSSKVTLDKSKFIVKDDFELELNVTVEKGGISSIIEQEKFARDLANKKKGSSLTEQYFAENGYIYNSGDRMQAISEGIDNIESDGKAWAFSNSFDSDLETGKLPTHHRFDRTLDDDMEIPKNLGDVPDGFIDTKKSKRTKIKNMNGCIVKTLKRERITPMIIDDICLGYYYFEFDNDQGLFDERYTTTGMVNTITGLMNNTRNDDFDVMHRREQLLRKISSELADRIDADFIDKNQDLKKEIYYILKYNDDFTQAAAMHNSIRVSYIPPEDIHHLYFKLDKETGRGISDLHLSMIPAKLWVAIYITNCLAVMTRGNDKRVYYVRQTVETNISKTLLKTINEIKKSNFGIRQIENINSVLNLTGRFNDYIIPRGPDGQSPVEFEVMQGQQVEIKTDLLNLLEESAINPTNVPIDAIQNRMSQDFAIQLTMSNTKFLRSIYDRQADFEKILQPLITKMYNIEYQTNDIVKIILPPPLFINITNTTQLITNTNDYVNNIMEIAMGDEQDEQVRARFLKDYKLYCLGSYIRRDTIDYYVNKARQDTTMALVSNPENLETEQ